MKDVKIKCMKCSYERIITMAENVEVGKQLPKCDVCNSWNWFILPVKEEDGEVANLQLFLTRAEYSYLLRMMKRKMFGIHKALKAEKFLLGSGKQNLVENAKKSYPVVQSILEKLRSLAVLRKLWKNI